MAKVECLPPKSLTFASFLLIHQRKTYSLTPPCALPKKASPKRRLNGGRQKQERWRLDGWPGLQLHLDYALSRSQAIIKVTGTFKAILASMSKLPAISGRECVKALENWL